MWELHSSCDKCVNFVHKFLSKKPSWVESEKSSQFYATEWKNSGPSEDSTLDIHQVSTISKWSKSNSYTQNLEALFFCPCHAAKSSRGEIGTHSFASFFLSFPDPIKNWCWLLYPQFLCLFCCLLVVGVGSLIPGQADINRINVCVYVQLKRLIRRNNQILFWSCCS